MSEKYLVDSPLFFDKVDIELALSSYASQEGHDGAEHDLMMEAKKCINRLRNSKWDEEKEELIEIICDLSTYGEWSQPFKEAYAKARRIMDEQQNKKKEKE